MIILIINDISIIIIIIVGSVKVIRARKAPNPTRRSPTDGNDDDGDDDGDDGGDDGDDHAGHCCWTR